MKKLIFFLFALFFICYPVCSLPGETFYIIPVKGVIDLGLSSFIKRALAQAKENNAKAIILEVDTFGGRVDAAVEITDALEKIKPITTVAFIDDHAWSAGALISLACSKIIMSPGASIGSAEPRAMGFGAGKDELTDEKVVSAIRAKFKSLAEENNYPANLAVAMVDKDVEVKQVKIKGQTKILTSQEIEEIKAQSAPQEEIQVIKTINPKGKLLNLTAKEAQELGLAEAVTYNRSALIKYLGLDEKDSRESKINWSEAMVRFITHPMVSPLLLTLGFLGLIFELKIPGWGISGTLGVILLALFFWGHYLAGLADWTEILIFALGVILLFLEIFVIPGFGLAGVSGIILIFSGIFLGLIKHPLHIPGVQLTQAFFTLGYTIVLTVAAIILSLKFIPKTALWRSLVLTAEEKKEMGFAAAASLDTYLEKSGRTITKLRPSGKAVFEGKVMDVESEGGFIENDKPVKVIYAQGNKLVVEEVKNA